MSLTCHSSNASTYFYDGSPPSSIQPCVGTQLELRREMFALRFLPLSIETGSRDAYSYQLVIVVMEKLYLGLTQDYVSYFDGSIIDI